MAVRTFPGTCSFCSETFTTRTITRHLSTCAKRQEIEAKLTENRRAKTLQLYHLYVEGIGIFWKYWLHIELPAEASLRQLDQFLRDLWLECCGHLSAFTIVGQRYSVSPIKDAWFDIHELDMKAKLQDVLHIGDKFKYEYDFGTTTELTLKVVGERKGQRPGGKVQVLARNTPPEYKCEVCRDKPATDICTECLYSGKEQPALFCETCAEQHEHYDEMFLPLVNSPRTGECGYTG